MSGPTIKPFDLMELIEMARVDGVAAVGFAGHDDRDRRSGFAHRAHLHRRRVRAQHEIGPQVKRVEAFARRMIRRDVQRVEVVGVGLDLRTLQHGEAEPREVPPDVVHHAPDRMDRTDARGGCRGSVTSIVSES